MVSKEVTIVNPSGLHLRPAGVLAKTSMKFKCDVIIECGEKRVDAKSVLNVMGAGIKTGSRTYRNASFAVQPSTLAASSRENGMPFMNVLISIALNGMWNTEYVIMSDQ